MPPKYVEVLVTIQGKSHKKEILKKFGYNEDMIRFAIHEFSKSMNIDSVTFARGEKRVTFEGGDESLTVTPSVFLIGEHDLV